MALRLPGALEHVLKGAYRSYYANAKFVTAASVPHINFMATCVIELYGLDPQVRLGLLFACAHCTPGALRTVCCYIIALL